MDTLTIHSDTGVPFLVRIIRNGERYGLDDCLTHTYGEAPSRLGMMAEFYDRRHEHTKGLGQFVSRYYVSTLLGEDPWSNRSQPAGLLLDGGNPFKWSVDAASMDVVRAWLRYQREVKP